MFVFKVRNKVILSLGNNLVFDNQVPISDLSISLGGSIGESVHENENILTINNKKIDLVISSSSIILWYNGVATKAPPITTMTLLANYLFSFKINFVLQINFE